MSGITLAIVVVSVIGVICAIVLSVASKVMYVFEDERIGLARECLPGANCGACGFAGCDGYAKALVEDPDLAVTLCPPGGAATVAALAEALGREAGDVVRQIAVIKCNGNCDATGDKMDYHGIETCAGAKMFYGGKGKCPYSCLGLGDCAVVCPEDAIWLENGIAHVDAEACIGCGLCVKVCPNLLIAVQAEKDNVIVSCSNKDKGALTRKSCTNGCIACKMCEKKCEYDAIKVIDNVAVIDYEKCTGCGACVEACKPGCIIIQKTG